MQINFDNKMCNKSYSENVLICSCKRVTKDEVLYNHSYKIVSIFETLLLLLQLNSSKATNTKKEHSSQFSYAK